MGNGAISFANRQGSGDQELAGAPPLAINVLVDGAGAVRRRPGISAWDGAPTTIASAFQVDGMRDFEGELYYVNSNRQIRKVTPSTATDTNLSTGGVSSYLEGSSTPFFAETPYRLVIVGGASPSQVTSGATVATLLGGSPPDSTQVVSLASRIFTDDNTNSTTIGHIRFSGIGLLSEESFDALDYVTAEADPDDIVALRGNSNEAFAFGVKTLQVFSPDPIAVLASGRAQPIGCASVRSVIQVDEQFAWLDDQRRFVLSDGRGYQEISGPIAATLDRIDTVTDCYGFRVNNDQFDCLTWVFPSDGRSFCWEKTSGGWSQWNGWTSGVGHSLLPVKSHHYWSEQGAHLVGLETGQIAQFDTAANTDLGGTIKAEVWTGFENRGTDAYKHCEAVRLALKRGQSSTGGTVLLSWRDDQGAFCDPLRISLGTSGDYVTVVEKRSLGRYRRRQWKLEMTDAVELVVAGVEEVYS